MEQNMVQIDAPDFDPDIDKPNPQRAHNNTVVVSGQELFTSPEPEFIDATNTQEEASDSDQFNTGHLILKDSHRPGNSSQKIPHHLSDHTFSEQQQTPSIHNSILDEIPPLEEDWENGQFTVQIHILSTDTILTQKVKGSEENTLNSTTQRNILPLTCNIPS